MLIMYGIYLKYLGFMYSCSDQTIMSAEFFIVCTMSGVIGFGLNIASFYCVQQTSAVTYAIIGTLNKIPLIFVGM